MDKNKFKEISAIKKQLKFFWQLDKLAKVWYFNVIMKFIFKKFYFEENKFEQLSSSTVRMQLFDETPYRAI